MGLSTVMFINTFYLLPSHKIPWPLPENYKVKGKGDENGTTKHSSNNLDFAIETSKDRKQSTTEGTYTSG